MGVKGSALATVIAQFLSVSLLYELLLFRKKLPQTSPSGTFYPKWYISKEILILGIPSFIMMLAESLSAVLVNRTLIPYGGDMAVSAFGIVNRIFMFAMLPGIAIGQGMQPILGFNYGARHFDRVLRTIKLSIVSATIFCIMVFAILNFFPEPLIRIFTNDTELIALNIGSIVRTANAFNVAGVHVVGRRRWNRRGAMVTDAYLSITHHPDPEDLQNWARAHDLPILAIDVVPGAVPIDEYEMPRGCVLLFGQEGPGLSPQASRAPMWSCPSASTGPPDRSMWRPPQPSPCTAGPGRIWAGPVTGRGNLVR